MTLLVSGSRAGACSSSAGATAASAGGAAAARRAALACDAGVRGGAKVSMTSLGLPRMLAATMLELLLWSSPLTLLPWLVLRRLLLAVLLLLLLLLPPLLPLPLLPPPLMLLLLLLLLLLPLLSDESTATSASTGILLRAESVPFVDDDSYISAAVSGE